jgi:AraC-like DNA-binding protein
MKAQYERIVPPESNSFKAYAYSQQEFDTPWHYHPEFELTYILSSRGVRYVGNSFENFEEDDFILLGPDLPHCWKNTEATQEASAIVLHWDFHLLGRDWLEKREFAGIRDLFQLATRGIRFDRSVALTFRPKLQHVLTLAPFERLLCLVTLLQELAVVREKTPITDGDYDKLRNQDHLRIQGVHQFVRNHYHEKITLAGIAEHIHMAEESFSRFFSRAMNKPFFTFLNEYRINEACRQLIGDQPIAQVAFACGFESLPFFYRQFQRYKHCSPGKFRAQFRKL